VLVSVPCTSLDTKRLSKYPSLSIVIKFLASLFSCYYLFAGSSSVLVADTLVEGSNKDG
jgi:hypothetical protein